MIHMLSRFDLTPGSEFSKFQEVYFLFVDQLRGKGLVESAGSIGRRTDDTPMDTDTKTAPEYYAIMSFKDRTQLDEAYEYILQANKNQDDMRTHKMIQLSVANPVFTCWQDLA